MNGNFFLRWGGPPAAEDLRVSQVGDARSPIRAFFDTFTTAQTDEIKTVVRTGQGLDLLTAIGSKDDDIAVYYLRKFARSLEPDQVERLKKVLTRPQVDAVSALTGQSW